MIIEISGVSTANKGAELMLCSILRHFRPAFPVGTFAVGGEFGGYVDRAAYQLLQRVDPRRLGRSRLGYALLSPSFRQAYGLVREREISVLLDASGFAFGDQLGAKRAIGFAERVRRLHRRGVRIILLPQAFGPFENAVVRKAIQEIVGGADLVFARDAQSYDFLTAAAGRGEKIRLAPDFTPGGGGAALEGTRGQEACVLIVPNYRMMDQVAQEDRRRYVPLLSWCANLLLDWGMRPAILLHDRDEDRRLLPDLQRGSLSPLPVIEASDPVKLRAILGKAFAVVGSRYHALVGSLSQGVPSVGLGWSHKYEMLFREYGCPEMAISVRDSRTAVERVLRQAVEPAGREGLIDRLAEKGKDVRLRIQEMWKQVDSVIGVPVGD